jgi:NTE family protein
MKREITTRFGIALGGGAARGFGHIPMLEVFDELGIKPAVIAGCSMGALLGAIYATGMPARQIREHAERLLTTRLDFARYVFQSKQTKVSELLALRGLMSMHVEGAKLVDLAFPGDLPQTFEELKIPMKIVATDYERMEPVVFTKGSLRDAIGASIAIPGIISSPLINGRVHVDGGVTNPVPFDLVRGDCDVAIAIDVTGKPPEVNAEKASNMDLAVGSLLIMFQQLADTRRALNPPDIYIRPPVAKFGVSEFFRAKEIMAAADAEKDHLKRAIALRLETADSDIAAHEWANHLGS